MNERLKETPLYLLIDQGGQSSRVSITDAADRECFRTYRPVVTHTPEPGRGEQDGELILADVQACLREAMAVPELESCDIAAAGLAAQRGNVLCWDHVTGRALTPVLSWHDQRQPQQAPPADISERVRQETGLRHSPYGGAAKLKWCLEAVPAVADALARDRLAFGPLGAFLVRGLVEENPHRVDETLAQRTLLFSRHTRRWSAGLLEAFELPAGPLPAPVPSQHDFGNLLSESGHRLPLRLLIGDQNVVPDIDPEPEPAPELEKRYRQWRQHMPPVPEPDS